MRIGYALLVLWFCLLAQAQQVPAAVTEMLNKNNVAPEDVSIWVQGIESEAPLVDLNGKQPRHPASVEKVLTTASGLIRLGADFRWHLEGSTTDTAALDFYLRSDVVEGSLPDLQGRLVFLLDLLAYNLERGVEDIEGDALLTVVHQVINELRHLNVTKYGIREYLSLFGFSFSHCLM